ncbi:hypothetical protein CRG98_015502 [Punica granatum]|uniref:CCHC-type domain-containing protein n=1 Tax=Punica granatum TaxID=22663 RepID=A0A2I0K694_PUNGR|nr:hypothetical protein CRG98_015502 [Punica granatum]
MVILDTPLTGIEPGTPLRATKIKAQESQGSNVNAIDKNGDLNALVWKEPQKPYYTTIGAPDLVLEEKPNIVQNRYSANAIYEWNIDRQSEYNILSVLQQMMMVSNAYKTQTRLSDPAIAHMLIAGQYKDTFLTRVMSREDCNQPFWKEKFLAGLPTLLGEQVRNEIKSINYGQIPYKELSYGELISFIMESSSASSIKKTTDKDKGKSNSPFKCFKCGKTGHTQRYCYLSKKIHQLEIDDDIKDQVCNLLIESSDSETDFSSASEESLQADELDWSSDEKSINVLTRDQEFLLGIADQIQNPLLRTQYLEKLNQGTLEGTWISPGSTRLTMAPPPGAKNIIIRICLQKNDSA